MYGNVYSAYSNNVDENIAIVVMINNITCHNIFTPDSKLEASLVSDGA